MRPVRAVRKPLDLKFYLMCLALVVFALVNLLYFSPGTGLHLPRHGREPGAGIEGHRRSLGVSSNSQQIQTNSQDTQTPHKDQHAQVNAGEQLPVGMLACMDEGTDCDGV